MSANIAKAAFRGARLVDFTGKHEGFQQMKHFGEQFIDLVRQNKDGCRAVVIIDNGFGGRYTTPLLARDHINLSGDNPLVGPNNPLGERFPIVQGVYFTDCLKGASTGVVAGLKEGVKPTGEEQQTLKELGIDVCSYNLVPAMLIAAHAGWKVLGIILPEGASLSAAQIEEIRELTKKEEHKPKSVPEAIRFLENLSPEAPSAAVILGSGVNVLENLDGVQSVSYADVFGISPGVLGHSGTLSLGRCSGRLVAVLRGRFHCYEGHDWDVVTLPTRVLIEWGVKQLFVTNAAGGINQTFSVGDLMLITGFRDHLSMSRRQSGLVSVLRTEPVSCHNSLTDKLVKVAVRLHHEDPDFTPLQAGVYSGLLGPNFETMAEIELLKFLKSDAVGMSTVPELLTCKGTGTVAAALSVITNVWKPEEAVGGHEEVLCAARQASRRLDQLFRKTLAE
jgi:purine-nucleoside phosphorylase